MSLGNISSPRVNEQHFRRALQLLRTASQIPGYSLSRYLQQCVRSFAREKSIALTPSQIFGRLWSASRLIKRVVRVAVCSEIAMDHEDQPTLHTSAFSLANLRAFSISVGWVSRAGKMAAWVGAYCGCLSRAAHLFGVDNCGIRCAKKYKPRTSKNYEATGDLQSRCLYYQKFVHSL